MSKFSRRFYSAVLALTIPFYLLLYGASGHSFDLPTEDIAWMIVIVVAFVTMMRYLTLRKSGGHVSIGMRVALGVSLIGTGYGAIRILLSMMQFEFDDEVSFFIRGLFYLVPTVFLFSIVIIFLGLFRTKSE